MLPYIYAFCIVDNLFEDLGLPKLNLGKIFNFDFKIGNMNISSIFSFFEKLGQGDLNINFKDLIHDIAVSTRKYIFSFILHWY